jgi:thiol-disulfide isomerase/thioredoxin
MTSLFEGLLMLRRQFPGWIARGGVALALAGLAVTRAQDPKVPPPPPTPVDRAKPSAPAKPAEGGFAGLVSQLDRRLDRAPAWTLSAVSRWTRETPGQPAVQGLNRVTVHAAGAKVRIEVRVEDDAEPTLLYVADGSRLERAHLSAKLRSTLTTARPLSELGSDPLLGSMLEGTGLDYILRDDRTASIIDRVTSLTEAPGGKGRVFELQTNVGRTMRITFTDAAEPTVASVTSSIGASATGLFRTETEFTWSFPAAADEKLFVASRDRESAEVLDLHLGLLGEDARQKLGKPAPALTLVGLARGDDPGGDLVIGPESGATVLFFWAEWCAPSLDAMPTVNEFVGRWKAKGVRFVAVNVGQSAEDTAEFLKTRGAEFPGKVALDPEGKSLAALGLTRVPAAVVIGADGKLAAVFSGPTDEIRADLRSGLGKLLDGK